MLHLGALSESKRILDVDAQIANGALDLLYAYKDLHSAQVACLLKMMDALVRRCEWVPKSSARKPIPVTPLINKSSILPSADMIGVIDPAWKDELVKRAASAFKP